MATSRSGYGGAPGHYVEAIPSDEVPVAIVSASKEAAFLALTESGSLSPVITGSASVKRKRGRAA